jgi:hypothetical protein
MVYRIHKRGKGRSRSFSTKEKVIPRELSEYRTKAAQFILDAAQESDEVFATATNIFQGDLESSLERAAALELYPRFLAGEIQDLKAQESYRLYIKEKFVATYTIDFQYVENKEINVIECKGYFHQKDRLRFKMFLATIPSEYRVRLQDKNKEFHEIKLDKKGRIQKWDGIKWVGWRFSGKKKRALAQSYT